MDKLYTVTELAHELGITARSIRFYESKDLLSPQRVGTTRVYNYRDHARLKLILRGKRLGFTLAEVKEYLDLYNVDVKQVEQQRMLLKTVRTHLSDLEQQKLDLEITMQELSDIEQQALGVLKKADSKQGA